MTAINPSSGAVGVGPNAAAAFGDLGTSSSTTSAPASRDAVVKQIDAMVVSDGYMLINATSVSPTVYVNVGSVSLSAAGANATIAQIASLLQTYGPGSVVSANARHTVYAWTDSSGINFGLLSIPVPGVTYLYYVTIGQ
jgi:hypothetical protein